MTTLATEPTAAAAEVLLEAMVRTPSPSRSEAALVALLVDRLPVWGYEARSDAVGNLVATLRGSSDAPPVVLLGHVDTVPGEPPVRRVEGRLYGRGSVDAKGPLAAFLTAGARVAAAGPLPRDLVVIGCVEEEVPSSRGARHAVHGIRPSACIVGEPSGWSAVTLGYKGYLSVTARFETDGGHGAHDRRSAAELACAAWQRVETSARAWTADTLFDRILVRLAQFRSGSDWRGREWAELDVGVRLPPALPPDEARRWLAEPLAGAELTLHGAVPAFAGSRGHAVHRALRRGIANAGGRPRDLRKTGTADLNLVAPAWGCPAVAYGPGDAALDHTPDEHLELAEFHRAVAVLEHALGELLPADAPRSRG